MRLAGRPRRRSWRTAAFAAAALATCLGSPANARPSSLTTPGYTQYGEPPVEDDTIFYHLLFNQLEGRTNGPRTGFRWDGEAWIGTDANKLWFKSEGFAEQGRASDGDSEALYARPIPRLRYFDAQVGIRYDLDSNRGRTWGAIGVSGLAPYWFQFEPTLYFSGEGRFAGRIVGSYDLLITNRLIAQPEFEVNFYSKSDRSREIGSGASGIDTGLRIRYEFSRKIAPYLGFAYTQAFGETATLTRDGGGLVHDPRFIFGMRVWY